MAESQLSFLTRSTLLAVSSLLAATQACALSLGEADLRSFQGQPLELRIPISLERGEFVALDCFKVQTATGAGGALAPLGNKRFRLEESLDSAILLIRSHEPFNTQSLLVEVVARCPGAQGNVTRQYRFELPPLETRREPQAAADVPMVIIQRPGEAPIVQPLSSATPTSKPSGAEGRGSRTWRVTRGDTLDRIARGVYPKSARMRTAFIARLREANAQTLPGDKDALPEGMVLNWPDLVALANASPRLDPATGSGSATAPVSKPPAKPVRSGARESAAPATARVEPARKPPAPAVAEVKPSNAPTVPKPQSIPPAGTAPRGKSEGGFTLRLSGADLDLSRSKGVSESTRAALREKQLLLDADDQVAALLSLRNTVKQLEGRLNDMQLKLSTLPPAAGSKADVSKVPAPAKESPPAPAPAEPAKPAARSEAPTAQPVPSAAPQEVIKANPPPPQAAPAGEPAKAAPKPQTATKTDAAGTKSPADEDSPWWLSPYLGAGLGLLLLLIGLAVWAKRKPREEQESDLLAPRSAHPLSASPRSSGLGQAAEQDSIADQYGDELEQEFARTSNQPAYAMPPGAGETAAPAAPRSDYRPQDTLRIHAPITQETEDEFFSASLELDTRPATPIDFVLGDEAGEDKSRRQRYMEERFPELATRAISVDDPDSIIDVARHHYEESELQRAVELLTYAFEERPGQLRFWLALFEIYRLEQRTDNFLELATRFKNVHGGTDAWPKVQHIGRDLDPSQALYAAALGRLGVPVESDFDPVSENWLNVPMDFTSEVLMIELRQSLLAEHGVNGDRLARPLLEVS